MNFLFFISEKGGRFHSLIEDVLSSQNFENFFSEQEKKLIVHSLPKKHKNFYFEYCRMDAGLSPDLKYWLTNADFLKVRNDFSFPILHEFFYHGTDEIELYLDVLVQEIHNSELKENVYFGDELSDDFISLVEFTKRWKNNKMFFFLEN